LLRDDAVLVGGGPVRDNGGLAMTSPVIPTAEEVFDKPYPPAPPLPPAWEGDSIAVELADRECARLIANQLFEPPIHEAEIDKYSRRFGLLQRNAETEIRRQRYAR